ncbi:hypothetical protein [Cupriavidus campinensis]
MGTQRPAGKRAATKPPTPAPMQKPAGDRAPVRDLGADTTIWHTRGLQTNSRMRVPLAQRTPPAQLPPSIVPRLILWAVVLGVALIGYHYLRKVIG